MKTLVLFLLSLCLPLTMLGQATSFNDEATEIVIYPNPATEWIVVETSEIPEAWSIVNLKGQVMMENDHPDTNTINISTLPEGIYWIFIINHQGEGVTATIVKE